MNWVAIFAIFAFALGMTLYGGVAWAFVTVFLPTLIMFTPIKSIKPIPNIPEWSAPVAAVYGLLLGMPFRSESLRFKFNLLDLVVILLTVSSITTAILTEEFYAGVNVFGLEVLNWLAPYFFARIAFQTFEMRKAALWTLVGVIAIVGVFTLGELRLTPYLYRHILDSLGLGTRIQPMAYKRFGLFRVAATFDHPIYFGNACLVLTGMILVLARTTGTTLKNRWVGLAAFGAFGCLIASLSWTPYIGLMVAILVLCTLLYVPISRPLLAPLVLTVILGMLAFTYSMSQVHIPEDSGGAVTAKSEFLASFYTRIKIIKNSWETATTAPPFGLGRYVPVEAVDLKSVDNSYLVFAMTRGWVYLSLWLLIPLLFAWRASRAFTRCTSPSQTVPLAIATGTVLGLPAAMFTVWAGSAYLVVWVIMLGFSNTLIDILLGHVRTEQNTGRPRGFPVQGRMSQNPGRQFPPPAAARVA